MPTPAADFTIFDGQELVVYTPSGGAPIESVPALRRPLTKSSQRNVESFVELHATGCCVSLGWHVTRGRIACCGGYTNRLDKSGLSGSIY